MSNHIHSEAAILSYAHLVGHDFINGHAHSPPFEEGNDVLTKIVLITSP